MKLPRLNRREWLAGAALAPLFGGTAATLPALAAAADDYPSRPINFICPWPAGGTADVSMRAICQVAGRILKQPIAVDNKAGAAGMIGVKALAGARPDGYTLGQIPISVTRFAQLGTVQANPLKDFSYLARTSGQTFGIAVPADSRFKTLKDMGQHQRPTPGQRGCAPAGRGGPPWGGREGLARGPAPRPGGI